MTSTIQCPSCNKTLPVTATSCKYCGEDLQPSTDQSFFSTSHFSAPPAPRAPRPQPPAALRADAAVLMPGQKPTPAPDLDPGADAVADAVVDAVDDDVDDDWIPDAEASKLIDLDALPAATAAADVPENNTPDPREEKTEIMAYPDMLERARADATEPIENTPIPAEPSDLFELNEFNEVSEVSNVASGLIHFDEDDLEDVDAMDEHDRLMATRESAAAAAVPAPAVVPVPVALPRPSSPPVAAQPAVTLPRPSLPPEPEPDPEGTAPVIVASEVAATSAPATPTPWTDAPADDDDEPAHESPLRSTKNIVLLSALVFVVTLGGALAFMWFSKDDAAQTQVVEVVSLDADGQVKVVSTSDGSASPATTTDAATPPDDAEKSPAHSDPAVPEFTVAGSQCSALGALDDRFPWKTHLQHLAQSLSRDKICEWFGLPADAVADVFKGYAAMGPTGSDAIPQGGRLEIYPAKKINAREPSIEFLFIRNRLHQVSLKYRDNKVAAKLTAKAMDKYFTRRGESKDALGRNVVRYADADLHIRLVEEKWFGRTLRTVVFSNAKVDDALADIYRRQEELEAVHAAAEQLFAAWKFDAAQKKYEELIAQNPNYGPARIRLATIFARNERFDDAAKHASHALETTSEDRVSAEARTILAQHALHAGKSMEALVQLKKAAVLLPTDKSYASYVKELESGEYTNDRLARTAARMECVKAGKYPASEEGVLARGFFPDKMTYLEKVVEQGMSRGFKNAVKNYQKWECP
ncbi:MAG: hypothetical protein GX146_00965 [Myxococcales bacterium]|nr:hypothetical protein [Myxococcales bacterium]